MIILGIHDGHNSGATIVKDGKILASVLEERLTRKKNESGFPKKSITACLKICEIGAEMRFLYTTALFNDYVKDDLSLEELENAA